jgi:hypothetical protein
MGKLVTVAKKAGAAAFKQILEKVIPVPGVGLAYTAVKMLDDYLDKRDREKLEYVRTMEERMGSRTVMDIGSVHGVVTGLSGSLAMEAILLASARNVCAWHSPNGCWVFHKNPKYRPCYRLKTTKIYRPFGPRQKDGTWQVSEETA